MDGGELSNKLKAKGVLVRHFNGARWAAFNRVTVGTRLQMDVFLQCVKEILKENGK